MHRFRGQWITDPVFASLMPREVRSRQWERKAPAPDPYGDAHILFRAESFLDRVPEQAILFFSADDTAEIFLNGSRAALGHTPGWPEAYPYAETDVTSFLVQGRNVLAAHTLYQGLINRVWMSGDLRHGLILDLVCDGETVLSSGTGFRTARHTGYAPAGTVGYDTQFLETYDSRAPEVGFELPGYDDSAWNAASLHEHADWVTVPQGIRNRVWETVSPASVSTDGRTVRIDFGAVCSGTLEAEVAGRSGSEVTVRCGQELLEDGSVRFDLRANCRYEEKWILGEGESRLAWLEDKSFRYAELLLPEGAELLSASLTARHYPFRLRASIRSEYADDPDLMKVWDLCVQTQRWGVQSGVQDCLEREKGYYLGDGCQIALTHAVLTGEDALLRRLIREAFATAAVSDTLLTCLDASFAQEIAEFPLILVLTILWHYRLRRDAAFLAEQYPRVTALLDAYRRHEKDGLLCGLEKWSVIEWPDNFRDGYTAAVPEGVINPRPHSALQAHYAAAVLAVDEMSEILGLPLYRSRDGVLGPFRDAFWDGKRRRFTDDEDSGYVSLPGNVYAFGYGLFPDRESEDDAAEWILSRGMTSFSMFGAFAALAGFARRGETERLRTLISDPGAWLRMLREGATRTFEAWGKDLKWNTSLFHLTFSCAALFLTDEADRIFGNGGNGI